LRILINVPFVNIPAGVSNHYLGLRYYFSKDVVYNQIVTMDYIKRKIKSSGLQLTLRAIAIIYDIIKFSIMLVIYHFPIVMLNPSFGENALKRDRIFLIIAKFFGCKVAVFIHGWDKKHLESIFIGQKSFSKSWTKVDIFFVLANEFKEYLCQLGITSPIKLTTTKVDDRMVKNVCCRSYKKRISVLLFLARIEENKGIFITVDTFSILLSQFPYLSLRVVGCGSAQTRAKDYVVFNRIPNVTFTGALKGEDLIKEYSGADIYILPTTHGEGMPTTVLEAMAFGLPIITRPVGGIVDFFKNGDMGFLIESLDPDVYAKNIKSLILDASRVTRISSFNMEFSKKNFMASNVARSLEDDLKKI